MDEAGGADAGRRHVPFTVAAFAGPVTMGVLAATGAVSLTAAGLATGGLIVLSVAIGARLLARKASTCPYLYPELLEDEGSTAA